MPDGRGRSVAREGSTVLPLDLTESTGRPADRSAQAAAGPARWVAGTLTYTTAGLVGLFVSLLFGDFALSMRDRAVGPVLQLIIKRLHANDRVMSLLIITLPAATSLLVVPVISYKSDRTRTRWGRRIPWLMVITPIAAACMAALAYADRAGAAVAATLGGGTRAAEVCGLLLIGLLWTAFECTATNPSPLVGGLINDVVPRPVLGRFYGLFRAVSLVAGILFNAYIVGHADVHFRGILLGIGVLFLVGFTVMCLTVREGEYPPPPPVGAGVPPALPPEPATMPPPSGGATGADYTVNTSEVGGEATVARPLGSARRPAARFAAIGEYLRDSFSRPYYVWIFAALTLSALAFLPFNSFSLPYALQVKLPLPAYGNRIAMSYACSLVLAWPVGWLVDRFSAVVVATGCVALYAVATLAAGIAVRGPGTFGVALVVHGVLSGCYFTSSASLGQALFPRDKYGQFFSAAGAVQALVTIGFGPVLGSVLDLSGHNYRLTLYIGCGTAALATGSLLVVRWYVRTGRATVN